MELKDYLGEFSYPGVISTLKEKLLNCVVETKEGKELVDKIYGEINNSDTPILKIRNFVSNLKNEAIKESYAVDLMNDIEKYIIDNRNMNFIINVCREEHLNNLEKNGIMYNDVIGSAIAPEIISVPSSEVINNLSNGEYDGLDSQLLINVKRALGIIKSEESQPINFFAADSYEDIRAKVIGYFLTNPSADTIQGINLLNGITNIISTTETPIVDVKEFIEKAKNLLLNIKDNRLTNTINFITNIISKDSYNYLINICREQEIKYLIEKGLKVSDIYLNPIDDEDDIIREKLVSGDFNKLFKDSVLFNFMLGQLGIITKPETSDNIAYLGEGNYFNIVSEIKSKLQNAEVDTITGTEYINRVYNKLNESDNITPMLEIKQFITNAQSISPDDTKLKDIVEFCKKKATTGDLNYIINMCKEEHFDNMKRAGHPDPEKTISDIKNYFEQPVPVIEKAIHDGIFDKLNSKLLNDVKTSLNITLVEQPKDGHSLMEGMNGYCEYNPIGVLCELPKHGVVVLCESDVLLFNKEHDEFTKLNESIEIPAKHQRLMTAISNAVYNPEKQEFSLNEEWDFNLVLNKDGKAFVGLNENSMKEIDSKSLRTLLLESIHEYENKGGSSFNKQNYLTDADNIVCLMENFNKIVKIDNLKVIRNLNENSYIMYDSNDVHSTNVPKILSINGNTGNTFKTFIDLNECIKETVKFDCTNLFESEIKDETNKLNERQSKLTSLMEQQKEINEQIKNVENLKHLADIDSPAMDRLNEQHNILNQALQKNFDEISFYQNDFELH